MNQSVPLSEVIEVYRRSLPPGELINFALTPFDRLDVPNQTATFFPRDGRTRGGTGYGLSQEAALVSALGEMTEEYSASRAVADMPKIEGTYTELVATRGEGGVCDPRSLCLEAGSTYHSEMPRRWVATTRYATGETVLVPIEFVATYRGDVTAGGYEPLVTPITNGLGAGLSHEAAIAHGLLELLQRDGNGLQIRALASTTAVDPASITDPVARELLDRFDAQGVDVVIKVAATDFGFTNLYVTGIDRAAHPDAYPLMAAAGGEASHPVALVALRKALLEWAAARARIAFMHGPLERVEKLTASGYLESIRTNFHPEGEEPRALAAMMKWIQMPLSQVRELMNRRVLKVETLVAFAELPSADPSLSDDKVALAQVVAGRLQNEGFDILVADFSDLASSAREVSALKVIVPGLEVETLSYGRIGERNLRRLMARDDIRLVGIGDAPTGALPIVLMPEAQARLGATPWLDTNAVRELIGPLYCLYREPGRHAAPLALERNL